MFYKYVFSFRKKSLLIHLGLFIICLSFFFPVVDRAVNRLALHSLEKRAGELIDKIRKLPRESMIDFLSNEKTFVFFQITLFDHQGMPIYDTHLKTAEEYINEDHSEVFHALKYGHDFQDRYSSIFRQSIIYWASSFDAHGQEYVLRIGFPLTELRALIDQFKMGFMTFGVIVFLLYGLMIWCIIHRLSQPIHQIVRAIQPYQEGKEEFIPRIELSKNIPPNNEFSKLVKTFNALNDRIQRQIGHLVDERERTGEIIESLGEGVIAVDINGSVTFANRVATKMLGASYPLMGQKFKTIPASRPEMVAKCQELIDLAVEKAETAVQTITINEGQKFYFDLIAVPEAQHGGMILVLQDKTSDYEVIEMGKDFIANASHELRTPITIIRGFAETLHDLPHFSAAQTKEITEKILKTCIRLDNLVKSLLTLADIENLHEEQFQMVDLVKISENCKQLLLVAQPNVQIAFSQKVSSAPIWADPDLLSMAVMNLLENAVKYSPSPACIELSMNISKEDVQLSIKDSGIGIPAADLPRIFDRFYTVDKARSRKFGGAGLGLSIVKTIIQKHSGETSVVSQLGQGSTFTIRLPIAKS